MLGPHHQKLKQQKFSSSSICNLGNIILHLICSCHFEIFVLLQGVIERAIKEIEIIFPQLISMYAILRTINLIGINLSPVAHSLSAITAFSLSPRQFDGMTLLFLV